jgi:hypothetical protein
MDFQLFQDIMTASDPAGGRAIKVTLQTGLDNAESYYTKSDPAGGRAIKVKLIGSGSGLQLSGGVNLSSSLVAVADGSNTSSPLQLSTTQVAVTGAFSVTATQTINVTSAASTTSLNITSIPWSSGNANQNHPILTLGSVTGSIWAASPNGGTYLGINATSGFVGNLLDFHINGGSSVFKVDYVGTATISNINLGPSAGVGGTLNLGNGGNGSSILAAGLTMYSYSGRHRFDVDGVGSAFIGRVYVGGNSATNVSAQFQIDSTVRSFLPPRLSTGQQQFIGAAISAAGSGYVNGTYTNVPLTGGTGTSAQATIVVSSGVVSSVTITTFGSGYKVADVLSASNSNLGGAGSGFTYTLPSQPVGLVHYNTTLNKLVVYTGAITNNGWETITSV